MINQIIAVLKKQVFGISILACAIAAFSFPQAFTEWGGVKLTSLVVPAIQLIMFGMGTTISLADFLRIVKRPWAVALGVFLQFLIMPLVGFTLAKMFGFSGSLAAFTMVVVPLAKTEARIMFSVAPTLGNGKTISLPITSLRVAHTLCPSVKTSYPRALSPFKCKSIGLNPISQPPGR